MARHEAAEDGPLRVEEDGPLRVEVVLAASVRAGDWLAGGISPDAPTTPVQPIASAWHITAVRVVPGREGKQVEMASGRFGFGELTPHAADSQCLVIKGLGDVSPPPNVRVEWAGRVREGDWLAGYVDSDFRERPVQVLDRALRITSVQESPGPDGRPEARMSSGDISLAPRYAHARDCLVIRRLDG